MRINNHYAETMMNVLMNFSQSSPMALRHPFAAQHIRTIELNTSRSFLYALLVTSGITFCTILILQQQSFSAIPVPNIIHVVGIIPKQDAKKNAGHESAQQKPIQQLRQSGGTPPSQSMNDATPVAKNTQDEQHHDSLQSSTGTSIATNSGQQGGAFSQGNDTDDKKTSGTGIQDNGGNQNEDDIEFNSNIEEYPIVNLDALQRSIIYPEMARQLRIEGIVYVSVLIGADGRPLTSSIISSPHQLLSSAAEKAVMNSTFTPARQHNGTVQCRVTIPVKFKLR